MDNSLSILVLMSGIILVIPPVCKKIHVPSIVGFILAGIAIGPYGFELIGNTQTLQTLGKLGMLYIMLQAGIEIDRNDFSQHRRQAMEFGVWSFLVPFLLGVVTSRWILGFGWSTSALLGAMYGSHTLMTYPIVSRYGVQNQRSVNIVVGGTILTITLALLVLAVLKGHMLQTTDAGFWWMLIAKTLLFLFVVLQGFPFIVRKAFLRDHDPMFSYMLVMTMLIAAAWLANWAGLEGILGAFLCGVALNKYVPNRSPLMQRINFIGNSLFVPLFLISVGMIIDLSLIWQSWMTIGVAMVMIGTKLLGKWLSSWMAQLRFGLSGMERQMMFGLTHATAAGTLAIVTIGYEIGYFSPLVLNGAVLMILLLCTTASFVTEHAAKELALQEDSRMVSDKQDDSWLVMSVGEDILQQLQELVTLSDLHRTEYSSEPNWQEANERIERTSRSVIVYHGAQTLSTVERLLVAVPRYAEKEHDFISCFGQIRRLSSQIGAKVIFYCDEDTREALQVMCRRKGKYLRASYREMENWEDVLMIAKDAKPDDMIVLISARKATRSFNQLFRRIPDMLSRFFKNYSYLILFPEQQTVATGNDVTLLSEQVHTSGVWHIIGWIKGRIQKLLYRIQTR